jgi:uncharacterized membrane protein
VTCLLLFVVYLDRFLHRLRPVAVEQDPAFGARIIVDIADKALSPAINDPTTTSRSMTEKLALTMDSLWG